MKIFKKRPLALILCIMLGGFSFFADFDVKTKLLIATIPLGIIAVIYFFDNLKQCRKTIVAISLLSLTLTLILSSIWTSIFFPAQFYDSSADICARVYDIDNSDSTTSVLICKTEQINGQRDKHSIVVYMNKADAVYVRKYDEVEFNGYIAEFSSHENGFDGRSFYISKGYSAIATDVTDLRVGENRKDRIDSFFTSLQLKISNVLKFRTDFETGAFLSALIVGNRNDLSGSTRLNFTRLGISHILALSGMHLAILSLGINTVLININIKKKIRSLILIVLVIVYMALTGFSSSVLRAGIMLIIANVLFLIAKKSDGPTTLALAVFLIVIFDPASVYDLSLWLSAFATLGVICFAEISEPANKYDTLLTKIYIAFKNGILVSVFAICATFAICAFRFSGFSVISVFTTLIFSFVIQFFIYGGLLLVIFGGIIPFGRILVLFSEGILCLAEVFSSMKYIYVSGESYVVKTLIVLLSLFFFAFLILDLKNKRKGILILLCLLLTVFCVAETDTVLHMLDEGVVYSPGTSGDTFLIRSDSDVTAIYSGKAFEDDAFDIVDFITDERIVYIDNFVFASYAYSTVDFIAKLMNYVKVEQIYVPTPTTSDEIAIAEGLSYLLERYGTSMKFYNPIEKIGFGDYTFRLFEKVDYVYGEYPSNVFEIVYDSKKITYLSACEYSQLTASAKALIYNSENLIIGSIGNTKYYLFDMHIPKVKEIMYYDEGRIAEDTEIYYKEKGALMKNIKTPVRLFD